MKNSLIKRWLTTCSLILLSGVLWISCNKDEEITGDTGSLPPVITLDNSSARYSVKIATPFSITPEVENGEGAIYSWKSDGMIISDEEVLEHVIYVEGEHYFTFRVDTRAGSDEVEILVDVSDKALPLISFVEPSTGFQVVAGKDYIFTPDVQNADNATFLWILNGVEVGTDQAYTFNQTDLGNYTLIFSAKNEDGSDEVKIDVEVVGMLPLSIVFPPSYIYMEDASVKTVAADRKLYLQPYISHADNPSFKWFVDDVEQPVTSGTFVFTPSAEGAVNEIRVEVTENEGVEPVRLNRNVSVSEEVKATYTLTVKTYGPESSLIRNTTGNAGWEKVYEFLPAPGQFINNTSAGYILDETTMDKAIAYAQNRLSGQLHVSLGGFGGYLIVGFDHSIPNSGGGYDFSILGNQFAGSSEPGIVWVMQDTNGNGLPDDEWYELKGSEYGLETTWHHYSVTYYRPEREGYPIQWKDNRGNYGSIDAVYYAHGYYPLWVHEDSYTLYGSRLQDKTTQEAGNGIWVNGSFDWGYADNAGSDANGLYNRFRISDAVYPDGSPANLSFIDFVKVHTGVNKTAGVLGEVSTEVFDFRDEHLK
ncbi:MAG: cell surface protein [Tannerellaceae bacterium]|nr:cell surface protein [Tannerellaceae bacterium]